MKIESAIEYLKNYDGEEMRFMEVCGTHTASIFKSGIRSLISPKIKLISGPGCPVCVTPTSYIDKIIEYATMENHVVLSFGDMLKVPGTEESLSQAKGRGARVELMYSPFEAAAKAGENPEITYVLAAVGFETTAPAYALALEDAGRRGLENIKLVTALKTVMPALDWICQNQRAIDGFICPGHVSVIIGSEAYGSLSQKYGKPFITAGFEPEHILAVIYDLVKIVERKRQGLAGERPMVDNLYVNAVKPEGNLKAKALMEKYFEPGEAVWRGLGVIPNSGLYLREEYNIYEGGSKGLVSDKELPEECCCGHVIVGSMNPDECSMFGKACLPESPYGPCMVSAEGACGIWFRNKR